MDTSGSVRAYSTIVQMEFPYGRCPDLESVAGGEHQGRRGGRHSSILLVSRARILGWRTVFKLFLRLLGEAVCQNELSIVDAEESANSSDPTNGI
jgi:hypothetical protein